MNGLGTTAASWSVVDALTGTMLAPGERARIQIAHCDQRSISCRYGSVETCSHHQTSQGQVSVWADGRLGTASGPCESEDALARVIRSARALALVPAPPLPAAGAEPAERGRPLDDALVAASTDALAARARALLEIITDRSRDLVVETLQLAVDTRAIASWHVPGAPPLERTARFTWAVSMMKRQDSGATALFEVIGCDDCWDRGWSRLRLEIEELTARLAATAPVRDLPPGLRVLLSPAAVADLVVPHLIFQLSRAGRQGSCELSQRLSLYEDPLAPGFFRTRARERDGTPSRRRTIVERGLVIAAMTGGGPVGLTIEPGELDESRLRSELGEVVCIGRFIGTVDPSSGRFSGVAKCGWLISPGQPDAFVPEFGISGDLRELVASIAELTTTRELVRGEVLCPGILVGKGLDYGSVTLERNVLQ